MGLLLVGVSFVIFQGDMNRYLQIQSFLKATAEECAAGAALYYDSEAYSLGRMYFQRDEASRYVAYMVEEAAGVMSLSGTEELTYELTISDERDGDLPLGQSPWVQVTLCYETEDLFRLSFLEVNRVVRSGKYELAEYEAQ